MEVATAQGASPKSAAGMGRSPQKLRGGGSPASVSTATGGGSPASGTSGASPTAGGFVREKPAARPPRDNAVMLQLTKTKMCAFFERGKCASNNCRYAHSADELRSPPNLQKTKLCRAFMQGNCQDENCSFAHGDADLRVTAGIYKTQMCNFFERGHCKKGDRCNHAHGVSDLRPPPGGAAAAAAVTPGRAGGDALQMPPRSALPLAELLANPEDATRVSMPTPTKSVTELASLAFSPLPQSPLCFPYAMPHALSPPGAPLGASPMAALWPRDPVDMLVERRDNKENEVPFMSPFNPLARTPMYPPPEPAPGLSSTVPQAALAQAATPQPKAVGVAQEPRGGQQGAGDQVALDLSERLASLGMVVRELSADVADLCGVSEGKRLLHKI